jgi:LPS-assembly protein
MYLLDENAVMETGADGTVTTTTPAKRSYQIRGAANEVLTPHLRASGQVMYFSDVVAQQTYNTNILDASRAQRTISGNLSGSWGLYNLRASYDRSEYFSGSSDSALSASTPRISFSRGQRPIGDLPIYFGVGSEYVYLQRGTTTETSATTDALSRIDVTPTVRVPFTKISFLQVNSSASWHGTFWTKSWDANQTILDQAVSRQYVDFQSRIVGPVFNRIFSTPNSGYAEKLKHTIEPYVTLRYVTSVDNFDSIVQWESVDSVVGGTTQVLYGITNHLFAKRKHGEAASVSREIVNLDVRQTYYTDARASQYDRQYGTAFTGAAPYSYSPVALTMTAMPVDQINATLRAEIDARYKTLRTVSTNGTYSLGTWLRTSGGWTLTRFIDEYGVSDPTRLYDFVNGAADFRFAGNHYGARYSLNYDVHNAKFVQQRVIGFYNAQCCGFAVEYQTFNFGGLSGVRVPQDNRFNFSFTLAGIGSFSNFFGALGGVTR